MSETWATGNDYSVLNYSFKQSNTEALTYYCGKNIYINIQIAVALCLCSIAILWYSIANFLRYLAKSIAFARNHEIIARECNVITLF